MNDAGRLGFLQRIKCHEGNRSLLSRFREQGWVVVTRQQGGITYLVFERASTKITKGKLQLLGQAVMVNLEVNEGVGGGRRRGRHGVDDGL